MLPDLSRFTPHGFCLAWEPGLIWLSALSNMLIAAAYFSIPAALVLFMRRRSDLAFKPIFGLFAAFILACGTTHAFSALTLWVPAYWWAASIDAITAVLSVATAITLWPLVPRALALPSPTDLQQLNIALSREVEQGRETAARLRESEARQRTLYVRTPATLHAVDAEGTILDVSQRWLELLGYKREEVIGQKIFAFYTPESAALSQSQLRDYQWGSLAQPVVERRMLCRDGRIVEAEIVTEFERDRDGRLLWVLAAVTDVTRQREAEAALHASEERLRHAQKMEAVGQLTGGIAHDFNNLLTAIMGSLELLHGRPGLDERAQRLAANAMEGTHRAARLTSQLLTVSRRQTLNPESLAPRSVVDAMHDLMARSLGARIQLEVTQDPGQWPVLADRGQLEAALLNLVINARDAITGPGQVTIALGNVVFEAASPARLDYEVNGPDPLPPGDYVMIAVADTGAGMDETVRARAFEPFFTTKPAGSGTGLGLAQIYGFITQSGGGVRIVSRVGKGTRIEMLLPRAQAAAG